MDKQMPSLLLSRRELIKSAGLLTGFFAINGIHSTIYTQAQTQVKASQLSISILVPPNLNQVIGELQQGIGSHQVLIDHVSEFDVHNFGTIEKFLKHNTSDAVVVFTSDFFAERLQPLFDAHNIPLIVINLGEDIPSHQNTSTTYQTLGLWHASQALGIWTGQNLGGDAIVMSSIYDSGYDALDAFHHAYTRIGGYVRDFILSDADQIDWDRIPDDISVLYASYSGKQAEIFWDGYHRSHVRHIPVAVSPFTLFDGQGRFLSNAYNTFTITTWGQDVRPFQKLGANLGKALTQGLQAKQDHQHSLNYVAMDANQHLRHHPIALRKDDLLGGYAVKVGWIDPFVV